MRSDSAAAALQAPQRRRTAVKMAAVPPGGRGWPSATAPSLLAAKRRRRWATRPAIVSAREELFRAALVSEAREEPRDPNLTVLGVTRRGAEAFNDAVANADGLIIADAGRRRILCSVVLPATGGAKRAACLSKHLNGKGYGPFVAASVSGEQGGLGRVRQAGPDAPGLQPTQVQTRFKGRVRFDHRTRHAEGRRAGEPGRPHSG